MPDLLQIHKALADETRLRLLRLLSRSPLNVNEVIDILRMGQSRISRHLRILAEAGLATRRREAPPPYNPKQLYAYQPLRVSSGIDFRPLSLNTRSRPSRM